MSTLVCLVSHQAMANVIPVLQMKPNKVILLSTEQEASIASNLKVLFNEKNIEVSEQRISAYKTVTIRKVCESIVATEQDVSLNATGGTKPMAITAFDVFRSHGKKVVYYEPVQNHIFYLYPAEENFLTVDIKLNIEDYLKSYGYEIINKINSKIRIESKRKFLTDISKDRYDDFIKFISKISKKKFDIPNIDVKEKQFTFQKRSDKIMYKDSLQNNSFDIPLSGHKLGDMLEDLLFLKLESLDTDDIKVENHIKKNGISNEIDIIFTKNCKMHLISCKLNIRKAENPTVYEISSLKDLAAGTFGTAYIAVPDLKQCSENFLERCKLMNVKVIDIKSVENIFNNLS